MGVRRWGVEAMGEGIEGWATALKAGREGRKELEEGKDVTSFLPSSFRSNSLLLCMYVFC